MFNRWERRKKGLFQTSEKRTADDLITDLTNLSIVNEAAESSSGENTDNEIISENNEIQLVRTEQPKVHAAHCECKCANSQALLTRYAECRICFEPLQSHGPCACPSCGGIWCSRCTKHLPKCPWCRAPMRSPAPPCLPLQRFLNDIELPCRNYKHGCTALLQGSQRMNHEIICDRESVGCPIKANCCEIKFKELGEHLQSVHEVIAVYSQKVKILIENFQTKLKKTASNRAKYKIVLLNHKSAFIIRVCLFNYHIKVECMRQQLGYAACAEAKQKTQYFAKVEFQNEALKTTLCEHNIGIENEAYGMKAEAQWNGSNVNQNESLAIHVAIDVVNPELFGKQKVMRKRSK